MVPLRLKLFYILILLEQFIYSLEKLFQIVLFPPPGKYSRLNKCERFQVVTSDLMIPLVKETEKNLECSKRYFNAHPEVYFLQFIFSFFGYIGVIFVLSMVKSYGALPTVTVTALRKVLTIVMSFFFFEKPFTMQYVWSGLLVLLGISFNIYR